jgi:hypothetical protein
LNKNKQQKTMDINRELDISNKNIFSHKLGDIILFPNKKFEFGCLTINGITLIINIDEHNDVINFNIQDGDKTLGFSKLFNFSTDNNLIKLNNNKNYIINLGNIIYKNEIIKIKLYQRYIEEIRVNKNNNDIIVIDFIMNIGEPIIFKFSVIQNEMFIIYNGDFEELYDIDIIFDDINKYESLSDYINKIYKGFITQINFDETTINNRWYRAKLKILFNLRNCEKYEGCKNIKYLKKIIQKIKDLDIEFDKDTVIIKCGNSGGINLISDPKKSFTYFNLKEDFKSERRFFDYIDKFAQNEYKCSDNQIYVRTLPFDINYSFFDFLSEILTKKYDASYLEKS